jgi:hypothetical protein
MLTHRASHRVTAGGSSMEINFRRVDILDWASTSPTFRDCIAKDMVVLWKPTSLPRLDPQRSWSRSAIRKEKVE